MADRSNLLLLSPSKTPQRWERRIVALRADRRWAQHGSGICRASSVHRAQGPLPVRAGETLLAGLCHGPGIRRYEHPKPGDMIHVDIKKNSDASPTASASAPWTGPQATKTRRGRSQRHTQATPTGTTPWMTNHALPTPASSKTRIRRPPPASGKAPTGPSPPPASPPVRPNRQRLLLPLPRLQKRPGPGHYPQTNPALPAPDQRQGRALQPHHAREKGLRPPLHLRNRARCPFPSLAP